MNTVTIVVESRYCCSNSTYESYVIELLTNDKDVPLYDDDGNLIEYNKDGQLFGYDEEEDNMVLYTKHVNHSDNMKKTYVLFAKLKYISENTLFTLSDMEDLKDFIHSYKIIDRKLPDDYYVVDEHC